tara:strand:- start:592 stop:1425 length:834 start_codon:yes stop_codon:yes gene_type:complete
MTNSTPVVLDKLSIQQRKTILEILKITGRGHIGSAFSLLEIVRILYDDVLSFNAKEPQWPDRDRFILSKGHGCLGLYLQLVRQGYFAEKELYKTSEQGAMLGGHPEYGRVPGVEASTGSLGHGLPIAVGIALAAKIDQKKYRTFVLVGDGECNEGSIWESALAASKHRLNNLTVIVDYNKFQCYGATADICNLEPLADKWRSFGFAVEEVNGHDIASIRSSFNRLPYSSDKPNVIIAHTVKGFGISELESNPAWHHKSRVPADEIQRLIRILESEHA